MKEGSEQGRGDVDYVGHNERFKLFLQDMQSII
jgi:hypothetical protein